MFSEGDIKITKIPESELLQIGLRLKKFVEIYRKNILIKETTKHGEDPNEILNNLDDISHKLLTRQYHLLFDDIRVIDFDDIGAPF